MATPAWLFWPSSGTSCWRPCHFPLAAVTRLSVGSPPASGLCKSTVHAGPQGPAPPQAHRETSGLLKDGGWMRVGSGPRISGLASTALLLLLSRERLDLWTLFEGRGRPDLLSSFSIGLHWVTASQGLVSTTDTVKPQAMVLIRILVPLWREWKGERPGSSGREAGSESVLGCLCGSFREKNPIFRGKKSQWQNWLWRSKNHESSSSGALPCGESHFKETGKSQRVRAQRDPPEGLGLRFSNLSLQREGGTPRIYLPWGRGGCAVTQPLFPLHPKHLRFSFRPTSAEGPAVVAWHGQSSAPFWCTQCRRGKEVFPSRPSQSTQLIWGRKGTSGVPRWFSRLRTPCCNWSGLGCCWGTSSVPGPGTSVCLGCSIKKKK